MFGLCLALYTQKCVSPLNPFFIFYVHTWHYISGCLIFHQDASRTPEAGPMVLWNLVNEPLLINSYLNVIKKFFLFGISLPPCFNLSFERWVADWCPRIFASSESCRLFARTVQKVCEKCLSSGSIPCLGKNPPDYPRTISIMKIYSYSAILCRWIFFVK